MNSVEFANDLTQKFQSFCLSGKNPFGITKYTQAAATIGEARACSPRILRFMHSAPT
jgi:hypothetical protein